MKLQTLGHKYVAQFFFCLLLGSGALAQSSAQPAQPTSQVVPSKRAAPAVRPNSAQASTSSQASVAAVKVNYAERYAQTCMACHGVKGEGVIGLAPVLAGQPSFYVITQLFLFKNGRRSNEAMLAISKDFSNDDLRGYSDYIGTLEAVATPAPQAAIDGARMLQGRNLGDQYQCSACHGKDFSGAPQVPRLAGQHEDYLLRVLQEFQSAKRLGYTAAMNEALSGIKPDELATLAYYLARLGQK